ncbi:MULTISPECIES: GNAT family N-acetyltransferase [unclassified Halomonas]|uniref:GNAT family N-acetyltransferase n=1 Tax=unclassified Halomonas TaxID=2609666 RepID=UPI00403424FD
MRKVSALASLPIYRYCIRRELSPLAGLSICCARMGGGQGIASALVKRVEAEAAAHGFERIYLYTPDHQALYRRLGWQDREDVEYRKEHVTVMARQLGQ